MRQTSIILIILFLITTPIFADVFVNLPDTSAFPNDTLRIPVNVSDLTNLNVYSYQFKIKYDSTITKVIGIDSAATLTETWDKTWINLETAGQVIIGNYSVDPLQNSGVLIYVLFKLSNQIGDSTQLEFYDVEFNAGEPTAITENGSLKILHPPISVSFNSNISDSIKILIDGTEKILPYDTTWIHSAFHTIGANSPQYKTADTRFVFDNWSDGKDTTHLVVPVSDTTFTLNMKQEYLLTLNSNYGTTYGSGWYVKDSSATFSVDSVFQEWDNKRYVFKLWNGTGKNSYTGTQRTNTIVMTNPVTETAEWKLQYLLKIDSPYGNPVGAGWYDQGDTAVIDIDSLVSQIEGTRYVFKSWSGKGNGSYSGSTRITEVVISEPILEQALWGTEHYLWIKSKPEGITQFMKSGWYSQNQNVVTDTAKQVIRLPDYVYQFLNWSADGKPLTENPIQILMDTTHTAEAVYLVDSVLVSITTNIGTGTSIFVDGIEYPVPYATFWKSQSEHIVAIDTNQFSSESTTRYVFMNWNDGGEQSHVIKADSALNLTAVLSTQHLLAVDTHPPGLIDFAEAGWYDQGDTVNLNLVPEQIIAGQDTFIFKGWHLDNMPVTGNPIQVIMDTYHSAVALYKDLYFINGKILDRRKNPVLNAELILSGAVQDTFETLASNEYWFNFLTQGRYQVTPRKDGFRFEPEFREYILLQSRLPGQNFIAIDTLNPNITLVYPTGGEQLQGTATDTISWQADDNVGITLIEISMSFDSGVLWQEISKLSPVTGNYYAWNIPDVTSSQCKIRVRAIDFDGNFAIDMSKSVFSIKNVSEISGEDQQNLPEEFEVLQNYPNPFNSTTALRFQIPETSHVVVRIFNVKGQEIVVLLHRELSGGNYQINWDGKDQFGRLVGSGIYFYQVEARSQVLSKRLLFLR